MSKPSVPSGSRGRLAGPGDGGEFRLFPAGIDDSPLDVIEGNRVRREQEGVVLPDELGVATERPLLEHALDTVPGVEVFLACSPPAGGVELFPISISAFSSLTAGSRARGIGADRINSLPPISACCAR